MNFVDACEENISNKGKCKCEGSGARIHLEYSRKIQEASVAGGE